MKVLVCDPVAEEGLKLLQAKHETDVNLGLKPDELVKIIGEYDALVVRSETKVTKPVLEAGKKLQVVGRAGVGVDNIDLEAATQQGIIVVNAPTSNTFSAAEHTMALMLAMARQIPQATQSLREGRWDRATFQGVELRDKTLGVVGLGRVGTEVARRARGFDMELLGYDPYVSPEHARNLGVEVVSLEDLFTRSDFITVHTPLTGSTRSLIGPDEIRTMKKGVRLLNVARGGIIDEDALKKAIEDGHVAGAAIDVFPVEPVTDNPLFQIQDVVVTPHLGASTVEAQTNVSTDVAQQIIDVLENRPPRYAVNIPLVPPETLAFLRPYVDAAEAVGKLAGQLFRSPPSGLTIRYAGELAQHDTAVLKAAALGGFLATVSEERVNIVNADIIAQSRGLHITELKNPEAENYANLVTVEVGTGDGTTTVSGTTMRGQTHIVRINDYWLEMVPTGEHWLIVEHTDRPGMIGNIGTVTGEQGINISSMQVSRLKSGGPAMTVLAIDEPVGDAEKKQIEQIENVGRVQRVEL